VENKTQQANKQPAKNSWYKEGSTGYQEALRLASHFLLKFLQYTNKNFCRQE